MADRLRLTNVLTGDVLEECESAEYSSDYLTPCDTFRFEAGSDDAPIETAKRFPPDSPVRVSFVLDSGVEGVVLDGYVDSVDVEVSRSGGGGRRLVIEGRDFLADVVDSNVDPRMKLPVNPTLEQIIDAVLMGQFGLVYEPADDDVKAQIAIGPRLQQRKPKPPTRPSRKSKKTQAKGAARPRDGESAYAYLGRMCALFGYNLSAGFYDERRHIILGGPNYDQDPYYTLRLQSGAAGATNNILYSSMRVDMSNVPNEVIVKGGAFGIGESTKNLSVLRTDLTRRPRKVFVSDARAKDKDTSERVARAVMGRLTRNFVTYRAKVQGISQGTSIYQVNTICNVLDDSTGTQGPMWVESCTLRKSRRSGTTTDLKLIPTKTFVLDWLPDEPIGESLSYGKTFVEQVSGRRPEDASYFFRDTNVYKSPAKKK